MNFGSSSPLGNALSYPKARPQYDLNLIRNKFIPPEYTFTRNSPGTYVGADGYIKTAAANEPRFDHDSSTGEFKGLLVEESRTNLARPSEPASTTNYNNFFPNQGGFGIYYSYDCSTTAASRIGVGGLNVYPSTNLDFNGYVGNGGNVNWGGVAGGCNIKSSLTYSNSFSFFINPATWNSPIYCGLLPTGNNTFIPRNEYTLIFDNGIYVGGDSWVVENIFSDGTYRLSKNNFLNSYNEGTYSVVGGSVFCLFTLTPGNNLSYWWFGGVQYEQKVFSSSYIPTSGSAVTRQPDQLILNKPFNSLGTFFVEATPATGTVLSADNGTSNLVMGSTGKEALYYNTNRTLRMSSDYSPVSLNTTPPQDLNRVSLGHNALANSQYINGYLKKFMYYGSPVTEDNLRSLTGNTLNTYGNILTDGLVLYLDAAAYTGGTTWYDLSGNGNTGTLVNGVGYDSANGGSLSFDGSNDVISGSTASLPISTTVTVAAWIRHNTLPTNVQRYLTVGSEVAVIRKEGNIGGGNATLHFYIRTNGALRHIWVNNQLVTNTWYYIVGTWDGTTQRFYKNAVQIGSSSPGGVLNGGNLTYFASSSSESLNGNIANLSVYNRALTASEIQQNFNALRGRFGI